MNDPQIRQYLKSFLDQQIKEKNLRKIEEYELDVSKQGQGIYDPTTETMTREMQVMQQHRGQQIHFAVPQN